MSYQFILDEIVNQSKEVLTTNLTGVYLHGSMAMGCFNPDKSDIDLIIVIESDISNAQKSILMKHIVSLNEQAPPKGLEISVVKREYCAPFVYPTPFELHFSPAHLQWFQDDPQGYIEKMNGEDIDLAAHFTIIKNYGVTLWGEKIETVFAPVPRQDYLDSICADVENAAEDILEEPIYIMLNLCRILAFVRDGVYLSKEEGGKWGIKHLPSAYQSMITEALDCYTSNKEMAIEKEAAIDFAKTMLQWIKAK